jgi:hypothetical protein
MLQDGSAQALGALELLATRTAHDLDAQGTANQQNIAHVTPISFNGQWHTKKLGGGCHAVASDGQAHAAGHNKPFGQQDEHQLVQAAPPFNIRQPMFDERRDIATQPSARNAIGAGGRNPDEENVAERPHVHGRNPATRIPAGGRMTFDG